MPHIGIIGAGIAGLTAAYHLQQGNDDISIRVLEATDRPGGVIGSHQSNGFLVEKGPNSLRPTPLLEEIITDLSLERDRVWANELANKRYIVRDGHPTPVPTSVRSFLTSDLFSTRAKLRLLVEPFISRPTRRDSDERLTDFTRRRLGSEVLQYGVAPFVGGVFAGDPAKLSAQHSFQRLVEWEDEYGSLFWGAIRSRNEQTTADDTPSGLFSFRNGLEQLPQRLAETLGDRITYNVPVTDLRHDGTQWIVDTSVTETNPYTFDAVISTVPLHAFRRMTVETAVDTSAVEAVSYPPVHIVALGYQQSAVEHPLDGFGILVPPVEDRFDILGSLFSSTLFPDRAPEDHVLFTTFVGGARDPEIAQRAQEAIQSIVERDLKQLVGVSDDPAFVHHVHWTHAIPQYTVGYGNVKDTLQALEEQHPGLFFAGNFRDGISVGDAMESGASASKRALASLEHFNA